MSASEKLKALSDALGGEDADVGIPLPQIVAVVEAAEHTEDGPNLTGGTYRICRVCRYDLNFSESSTTRADGHGEDCALAALDEALS